MEEVSRQEEIGDDAVEGGIERRVAQQVEGTEERRLALLGIAEIARRKGHRDFIALVTARLARGEGKGVGGLPDKKQQTVKQVLQSLPVRLKTPLKSVCTDLYAGFSNAVKEEVPAARRVADRCHVAKA